MPAIVSMNRLTARKRSLQLTQLHEFINRKECRIVTCEIITTFETHMIFSFNAAKMMDKALDLLVTDSATKVSTCSGTEKLQNRLYHYFALD